MAITRAIEELIHHTYYKCDIWPSDSEVIKSANESDIFPGFSMAPPDQEEAQCWGPYRSVTRTTVKHTSLGKRMSRAYFLWEMAMVEAD